MISEPSTRLPLSVVVLLVVAACLGVWLLTDPATMFFYAQSKPTIEKATFERGRFKLVLSAPEDMALLNEALAGAVPGDFPKESVQFGAVLEPEFGRSFICGMYASRYGVCFVVSDPDNMWEDRIFEVPTSRLPPSLLAFIETAHRTPR